MPGFFTTKTAKALPLWMLILVIPLLKSSEILDQGLLIRFIGLQIVNLLMLFMLFLRRKRSTRIYPSPLLIVYFLFVLFTGLRLLWGNVYSDSIFECLKIASWFLLFILLTRLYSFDELKSGIAYPLLVSGIVLATLGLIELFVLVQDGKLSIPLSTYQIKTVFGHRNLYLQILFLSFPFQLYGVLTAKSRILKWPFGLFSGLSLFLLIVLSNRAAWLALLTGFGLIILLEVWRRKITKGKTVFKRKTVRNFAIGLFSVLILSTLFFTFFTETSEAEKHLSGITSMESGSGKDRIELWKRTVNIIEEKPLFGCGAANWKIEMLKYGSKGLVSENNITFYQRPHNDFLWIFSEYGLVGGLLYLSLFVIAFTMLVVQLRENREQKLALFYYTLVFALTGFVIFSFLSFPHERIVHNILLSSFFAVIVSSGIKGKAVISPSGKAFLPYVFYFVSTTLIVVSLFVGYQRFVSESHTRNALFARMENEHETVIAEIRKANSPYYRMDPLSTPLSWYEGMAWYETGQADSALKYFSEAHQLNPYHVHVLNNLASAYAQIGKNDTAILYYKEALNIYPEFEDAALNLCAIYYNTGQTDSAFLVLKKVNINTENPNFKVFLKAVLKAQFVKLLQEQGKADWISYLPEDKEWYYRQYKISASQNKPIKSFTFESPDYFNY